MKQHSSQARLGGWEGNDLWIGDLSENNGFQKGNGAQKRIALFASFCIDL